MFKAIYKLKSDKRGFTLMEAIVTLTILLIAFTLTGQLLITVIKNYRLIEYKWLIQTATEYVTACFQSAASPEALATADAALLLYEDMGTPNDTGTTNLTLTSLSSDFASAVYDASDGSITFTLKQQSDASGKTYYPVLQDRYIYHLSYNENFYVLRYDDFNTDTLQAKAMPLIHRLKLVNDNDSIDIKVNVNFKIAVDVLDFDENTNRETTALEHGGYLPRAISATVDGILVDNDGTFADAYGLPEGEFVKRVDSIDSSISFMNMTEKQKVNYDGNELASKYVAGWCSGATYSYNEYVPDGDDPSTDITKVTQSTGQMENYPSSNTVGTEVAANINHEANIIKFHSVNTPKQYENSTTQDKSFKVNVNMPICLFFSATIGTDNQKDILNPIRSFRDNYLRGNAVGEWVIDEYYYRVSPAVVKAMKAVPALKGVVGTLTKGVSEVSKVLVD